MSELSPEIQAAVDANIPSMRAAVEQQTKKLVAAGMTLYQAETDAFAKVYLSVKPETITRNRKNYERLSKLDR